MIDRQVLIATTNPKKLKELASLLSDLKLNFLFLKDFPGAGEVEESGPTFEENAKLKALGYADQTGHLTFAEDSGLCCDALDGAPGVYSARFAGPGKSDEENNRKLLRLLDKVPDLCRGAYFKSAVALAEPGRVVGVVTGEVHGAISHEIRGNQGFGYDPLFFYPPFQKCFGEVPMEMKHQVSHRSKALQKARLLLEQYLNQLTGG